MATGKMPTSTSFFTALQSVTAGKSRQAVRGRARIFLNIGLQLSSRQTTSQPVAAVQYIILRIWLLYTDTLIILCRIQTAAVGASDAPISFIHSYSFNKKFDMSQTIQ